MKRPRTTRVEPTRATGDARAHGHPMRYKRTARCKSPKNNHLMRDCRRMRYKMSSSCNPLFWLALSLSLRGSRYKMTSP